MKKVISILMTAATLLIFNTAAMAQSGDKPYIGSTHTYTITMDDGTNNTGEWLIADASGTPLTTQPTFSTNVDGNTATMVITWLDSWASVDSDYKILFTETDGNSCISQRELDIDVIANTFYLTMEADASDCHDLSGEILGENESGNTTLLFTVNLNKDGLWDIDNWKFDFSVLTTGSYTIQSVSVNSGSDIGTSSSYPNQSVSGTTSTAEIEVVVNGPVETTADVSVAIENGVAIKGSISTPDNGSGNKEQTLTINPLPATSIISFD